MPISKAVLVDAVLNAFYQAFATTFGNMASIPLCTCAVRSIHRGASEAEAGHVDMRRKARHVKPHNIL